MAWMRSKPVAIEEALSDCAQPRHSADYAFDHQGGRQSTKQPLFCFSVKNRITESAYGKTPMIFGSPVTEVEYREFRTVLAEIKGTAELLKRLDKGNLTPSDIRASFGTKIDTVHIPWERTSFTHWSRFVELYLALVPVTELDAPTDLTTIALDQFVPILKTVGIALDDSAASEPLHGVSIRTKGQGRPTKFMFSGTSVIFEDTRSYGTNTAYGVREVFSDSPSASRAISLLLSLKLTRLALEALTRNGIPTPDQLAPVVKQFDAIRLAAQRHRRIHAGSKAMFSTSFEQKIFLDATFACGEALLLQALVSDKSAKANLLKKAQDIADEFVVEAKSY